MAQPGVTAGAVLELHAAKAAGGGPHTNADADRANWYAPGGVDALGLPYSYTYDGVNDGWVGSGTIGDPYALLAAATRFVDVPSFNEAAWPSTFTLEGWFYLMTPGAANYNIVGRYDTGRAGGHLFVRHAGSSKLQFCFQRSSAYGGSTVFAYAPTYATGWHHIAWDYDGSASTHIYLDGALGYQLGTVSDWDTAGMLARFVHYPYTGTKFAALRLYSAVLGGARVAQNYAAGPLWTGPLGVPVLGASPFILGGAS